MKRVYLDSSAIVKRYVKERGTEVVDLVFDNAELGNVKIFFSIWNIGEVLGVLDRYRRRNLISSKEFESALGKFASEFLKLVKLHQLDLIPLYSDIIADSLDIILRYHIYEADAIQIVSSKYCNSEVFLTADKQLVEIAKDLGINAFDVESEENRLQQLLKF